MQEGYRTGLLEVAFGCKTPFHPNNRGFDYFYGFYLVDTPIFRVVLIQRIHLYSTMDPRIMPRMKAIFYL